MLIEDTLELVNEMTDEELRELSRDDLMFIIDGMNEEDMARFFMEKNVKVFGGIDGYVDDFLNKVNLVAMNEEGKAGARTMLNRMRAYPGISEASTTRIQAALASINYATAPAAGGRRKACRKTRRSKKGLKRSRVRR